MKVIFAALAIVAGVAVTFRGATNQGLLNSAGIGPALSRGCPFHLKPVSAWP
jgi:hypothetical protein